MFSAFILAGISGDCNANRDFRFPLRSKTRRHDAKLNISNDFRSQCLFQVSHNLMAQTPEILPPDLVFDLYHQRIPNQFERPRTQRNSGTDSSFPGCTSDPSRG